MWVSLIPILHVDASASVMFQCALGRRSLVKVLKGTSSSVTVKVPPRLDCNSAKWSLKV